MIWDVWKCCQSIKPSQLNILPHTNMSVSLSHRSVEWSQVLSTFTKKISKFIKIGLKMKLSLVPYIRSLLMSTCRYKIYKYRFGQAILMCIWTEAVVSGPDIDLVILGRPVTERKIFGGYVHEYFLCWPYKTVTRNIILAQFGKEYSVFSSWVWNTRMCPAMECLKGARVTHWQFLNIFDMSLSNPKQESWLLCSI